MLPQMNDKFVQFVAPARRNPKTWRFLAGSVFFVVAYILLFMAAMSLATALITLFSDNISPDEIWRQTSPIGLLFLLASFATVIISIWLAVRLFRPGSLSELFGPGWLWPNFQLAAALVLAYAIVLNLTLMDATQPNLPLSEWLFWMVPALPLLLIQVTAEELVFRGYLLQEMAARFKSPLIWYVLPALLFGALHYNPETFGSNAWLAVASPTIMGLFLADVTVRTGNLGAAIGAHFANNFIAMMFVSLDDTMSGLSLFVTKTSVTDESAIHKLLLLDVASVLVGYVLYLGIMRWYDRRRLH